MVRDKIILFFFLALLLFVCYQLFLVFKPFIQTMFWAATIALILWPLHKQTLQYIKDKPSLASLITTLVVVMITLPVGGFIVFTMARQALDLYDVARQYVSGGGVTSLVEWVRGFEPLHALESKMIRSEYMQQKLSELILNSARSVGVFATGLMAGMGKNILVSLIHVILGMFFLFFIFRDGPRFYTYIYDIVPLEEKHKSVIFQKVNDTFSAVLRGQFLTAFVQGVLAGIIFFFLDIPLPFLLGFFTFLVALVPIVGAASIWVPVDIYLFAMHATGRAVTLLFLGIFLISMVDNFLKPYLIGKKAKLPTLFLFLGIIGGLRVYGILGMFLGPVLLSLFFALIKIYQEEYRGSKNLA